MVLYDCYYIKKINFSKNFTTPLSILSLITTLVHLWPHELFQILR